MTDDEAQAQLARDLAFAELALRRFGSIAPLFVIGTKPEPMVIAAPFRDEAEKAHTYGLIRLACIAHEAEWLCFMDEAWLVNLAPGEELLVQPKDSDRRVEVVSIWLSYRDGDAVKHRAAFRGIERDADGKGTGLGASPFDPGAEPTDGRVSRIFPQARPIAPEIAMARMALDASGALQPLPTAGHG
jgi:hypothetical protein